jgi:hypothetical protein
VKFAETPSPSCIRARSAGERFVNGAGSYAWVGGYVTHVSGIWTETVTAGVGGFGEKENDAHIKMLDLQGTGCVRILAIPVRMALRGFKGCTRRPATGGCTSRAE